MSPSHKGMIFNIQRYSIHDGSGIRTLVFLKGCPLRCLWCSNPESQNVHPELIFFGDRCTTCKACLDACKSGARDMINGRIVVDRNRCRACGSCAGVCPAQAARISGRWVTVDHVLHTVERDRPFYEESGGGVTLSGGEPAMQADFAAALLKRCHEQMISTAVETSGAGPWSDLKKIIDHSDLVLYDIKHADPERHRRLTGVDNTRIKANARRVAESGKEMIVRVPLIPGLNDDPETLAAICGFVKSLEAVREVHLLPYHAFGRVKYDHIGRCYSLGNLPGLDPEDVRTSAAREIFRAAGFTARVGG